MNIFENRKDSSPTDTVRLIKNLLYKNGIETNVVFTHNNDNEIYSVRVEFSTIPGLGTNGKGITLEYAMASAYGEFMERLESGFLVDQYYLFKVNRDYNKTISVDELLLVTKEIFSNYCSEESLQLISEHASNTKDILYGEEYFNIGKRKIEVLPETLIRLVCGSNGLCAGNSPAEALCQGAFEVFERFALKKLFLEGANMPDVETSSFSHLKSYHLLNYFTSKGYTCIVKDCTVGGSVPVVGILLIDPSRAKCKFALGSDLSFDIALQRCLTEVLQGYKFDFTFVLQMQDIVNPELIDDNWHLISPDNLIVEMSKQMISGSGVVPLSFFLSNTEKKSVCDLPFCEEKLTNEDTYRSIVNIATNNGMDIYVKDLSFLGFPAYRVFIPNASAIQVDFMKLFYKLRANNKLRKHLHNGIENDAVYTKILEEINEIARIESDYSMKHILGIMLDSNQHEVIFDTRKMELFLLYRSNNYIDLYQKFITYFGNDDDNEYIQLYLRTLINAHGESNIEKLLYVLNNVKKIKAFSQLIDELQNHHSISCSDCNICIHADLCYWKFFKPLYENLDYKMKCYKPNYNILQFIYANTT